MIVIRWKNEHHSMIHSSNKHSSCIMCISPSLHSWYSIHRGYQRFPVWSNPVWIGDLFQSTRQNVEQKWMYCYSKAKQKKGRGHWFQFDAYNNMSGSGRWSTCMAYSGIRHIHNKTTTPCTNLRGNLKTKLKSVTVAYIKEKNTYIKYIKNC